MNLFESVMTPLQALNAKNRKRAAELLDRNGKLSCGSSPSSEDGTWWEVRRSKAGDKYGVFINYEDDTRRLVREFASKDEVIAWLESADSPGMMYDWK